jgi:Arm DNA-binding domain
MPRRKTLTELQVRKLPRRPKRYSISDPVQPGLVLRVPPQGPVQFHAVAWRGGKAKWHSVGTTATASLSEARALARDACRKIIAGQPPTAPSLHSVADAANKWLKLKVETDGQITASEQKRIVAKYVVPHLGDQCLSIYAALPWPNGWTCWSRNTARRKPTVRFASSAPFAIGMKRGTTAIAAHSFAACAARRPSPARAFLAMTSFAFFGARPTREDRWALVCNSRC